LLRILIVQFLRGDFCNKIGHNQTHELQHRALVDHLVGAGELGAAACAGNFRSAFEALSNGDGPAIAGANM